MRNQLKAAAWISKTYYIDFVAFKHWMEFDAGWPDWEPTPYFHSIPIRNPPPLISPTHKYYIGRLKQTGFPAGIKIQCPLWFPLLICTMLGTAPWTSAIMRQRSFSLRTLLIATTLVAVVLGLIVYSASP